MVLTMTIVFIVSWDSARRKTENNSILQSKPRFHSWLRFAISWWTTVSTCRWLKWMYCLVRIFIYFKISSNQVSTRTKTAYSIVEIIICAISEVFFSMFPEIKECGNGWNSYSLMTLLFMMQLHRPEEHWIRKTTELCGWHQCRSVRGPCLRVRKRVSAHHAS